MTDQLRHHSIVVVSRSSESVASERKREKPTTIMYERKTFIHKQKTKTDNFHLKEKVMRKVSVPVSPKTV